MMMKTKSVFLLLTAACLGLSACVSPEVVTTNNLNDDALTCNQIKLQLSQLEEIRSEAQKGRTASGKNVAAGILFWPALIGNYSNAEQALEAANKRQDVLIQLADKKNC